MADGYSDNRDRFDRERIDRNRMERDLSERDRYGRADRGPVDRAGDEVRSWFGDEEAARRRRMDEQEHDRWNREDRWRAGDQWKTGSHWGNERSYSSGRDYGDAGYGWRGDVRESGWRDVTDRDYSTWRSQPPDTRISYGRYDRPAPDYTPYTEYGRQTYGGPYGRERSGAREWSSTEGWRVPGPHIGRGPRGYQRSDERIREELNDRLTAHGLIDATDVECRVVNGEVTLTGWVDSRAAKHAAEDIAGDLHGVRDVHNQLRVRSRAGDEGVGRTSVLGLNEPQGQTTNTQTPTTSDQGRPRTRA
jgi:osmotically-inducible protein OsmY